MIHTYITPITTLPDPKEHPELMQSLPLSRQEKILRHRFEDGRRESLGASLLLQKVLADYGKEIDEIYLGAHEKPQVDGVFFNVSHSHEWVCCAVSENHVGCDIQKILPEPKRVAERFFHKNEISYLEQFAGDQRNQEFCRLWTMKESYVKMTGEGMYLPFDKFEICIDEDVIVNRDGGRCSCAIKEYRVPGYCLSVCGEEKEFANEVVQVYDDWADR